MSKITFDRPWNEQSSYNLIYVKVPKQHNLRQRQNIISNVENQNKLEVLLEIFFISNCFYTRPATVFRPLSSSNSILVVVILYEKHSISLNFLIEKFENGQVCVLDCLIEFWAHNNFTINLERTEDDFLISNYSSLLCYLNYSIIFQHVLPCSLFRVHINFV